MGTWKDLPPTPNQMNAIHSYERAANVTILCKSKQDAHDVISLFVRDRDLTFKGGFIEGTTVRYKQHNVTLDILSLAAKELDDFGTDMEYDDELRDLEDYILGCNPYSILG